MILALWGPRLKSRGNSINKAKSGWSSLEGLLSDLHEISAQRNDENRRSTYSSRLKTSSLELI